MLKEEGFLDQQDQQVKYKEFEIYNSIKHLKTSPLIEDYQEVKVWMLNTSDRLNRLTDEDC